MGINKDQVQGRLDELKGKVQEVAGKLVGNQRLEVEGKVGKDVGAIRATVGDAKADLAKAVKSS